MSDIGTDPALVEANLTRDFKTARSWGVVLLIDEADVFMERRSSQDLQRNSLVAGELSYPPVVLPISINHRAIISRVSQGPRVLRRDPLLDNQPRWGI